MDQATAERIAASKISGIPIPEPQKAQEPVAAAPEAPPQEPQAEQPEALAEDQTAQGAESDQPATDSELEEIEFDGVKFALPRQHVQKVKDALLRESDYTRKTQEVSERARVVSEQERLFQAQSQFHKDSIDDIATIRALDQAIAQYANVNWMGMQTDELMRTRLQYDQLKEARQKATESLNAKWTKFNTERTEQLKKLEQAGREAAARKITGFNDVQAKELMDYARKAGYSEPQISMLFYNPLDIEMIWKAKQFDALQGTKGVINQRVNKAPPMAKPGPSATQKSEGEKVMVQFYAEKNKAKKEQLGAEILRRKMRI
jgi:hypothetical protein